MAASAVVAAGSTGNLGSVAASGAGTDSAVPVPLLVPVLVLALAAAHGGEPGEYMGRPIAATMHWMGARWLERPTRETEERTSELLEALEVRKGMTVCDIGCGSGYHAVRLARRVGATGSIVAVDVQREMLELTRKAARAAGVRNVRVVLAGEHDPRLPPALCDLVLLVDVYHELEHPEAVLAGLRTALKADGRVALVEFRGEDPTVPIKPEHKMTRAQATRELVANGFAPAGSYEKLPWQHLLFFRAAPRAR